MRPLPDEANHLKTTTDLGFAALGVPSELVDALRARGIEQPFPIQALTISDALAGRDVCGKAKTGSGKTLAFGLPVLTNAPKAAPGRPTALALVPTRELAVQVCEELSPLADAIDRSVVSIYGGARIEGQRRELERGADLVVATPG